MRAVEVRRSHFQGTAQGPLCAVAGPRVPRLPEGTLRCLPALRRLTWQLAPARRLLAAMHRMLPRLPSLETAQPAPATAIPALPAGRPLPAACLPALQPAALAAPTAATTTAARRLQGWRPPWEARRASVSPQAARPPRAAAVGRAAPHPRAAPSSLLGPPGLGACTQSQRQSHRCKQRMSDLLVGQAPQLPAPHLADVIAVYLIEKRASHTYLRTACPIR